MKYAIIIVPSSDGYGAYAPDLPGCVAVGDTVEETAQLMKEAVEMHLRAMKEDGDPIPVPVSRCAYIETEIVTPAA